MMIGNGFNNYYLGFKNEAITSKTDFHTWKLLESLIGKNVYWLANDCNPNVILPTGFSAYIVKNEGPDFQWLFDQAELLNAPIFVFNVCNNIYFDTRAFPHKNIHWLPWVEWHYQTEATLRDYSADVTKKISKKISCMTRISKTNKLIALSAVKKYHSNDCFTSFHNRCHQDATDVDTNPTNHLEFDRLLSDIPIYCNTKEIVDDIESHEYNWFVLQKKIHNFHVDAYQTCALNVTNESFFRTHHLYTPGPFLTEKTFNCILGETAFLANGQSQTYNTLEKLGFEFNYGIDLSYDNLSGDLDRLVALHKTIESLQYMDTIDIFEQTQNSCLANKEHVLSRRFYNICEKINEQTVQKIHSLL